MAASSSPPSHSPARPTSGLRAPRSSSRMSNGSRPGESSRASDEDTKTSVKVAVRVRPPLKPGDPGFELIPQRFQRSLVNVTSPTSLSVDSPLGRKLFVFDRVFGEDVLQDGVWDYISESVNAFLQGYNVSVMAYGQSGAGKSYTMGTSGPAEQSDTELMGVVPRAAAALFDKLSPTGRMRNGSGIKAPNRFSMSSVPTFSGARNGLAADTAWQMKASYVEIYNEQLRDLLIPESVPASERGAVTIREDTKGRILLTGLHQVNINSMEDLLNALNFGSAIRQTDATAINAKSSRSHAVFSINLVQKKSKISEKSAREKRLSMPADALMGGDNLMTVDSKLHFVDLAGSERMKNTGAVGERAKEGISINAGLASLGKVISQLSTKQAGAHVSYRDSKLTRLLQDSLGGNAITYMIACVNPAEFHISETLNTIQYAQRARAIQSKPKIQQVDNDGDKQALIDRLRAEVNFLRDQLRNAERAERNASSLQDRGEKLNEIEIDLQNQLLDVQENYTALSQRHAKLISEISRARDGSEGSMALLKGAMGDSAAERIQRSNSFSEKVEQVVLEYEKTIQSLESLLSSTRSTLATTESKLLERETKYAYVDTVNQQLTSRITKLVDRESSTEKYLHDLEARLDGRTAGEEQSTTTSTELRKEIARLRENESTSEEYISTLEERLAEADQDTELMQREISRLEHVVERQRSVGKLDSLLYELDNASTKSPVSTGPMPDMLLVPDSAEGDKIAERTRAVSDATYRVAVQTALPEIDEEDFDAEQDIIPPATPEPKEETVYPQTPAQSKFVEEKLVTVNQELFDLRVEHESTVTEFNLLSAKYQEALRTLAALEQSNHDPHPPRSPTAFLSAIRAAEGTKAGKPSSSRSLSSELSSAGESLEASNLSEGSRTPTNLMPGALPDDDFAQDPDPNDDAIRADNQLAVEIEDLKHLIDEKNRALEELIHEHEGLNEHHQDTLDQIEELKTELHKARMNSPPSPTAQLRRKSSQNVMTVDRAHRALAALGNIAAENFEHNPDVKESFNLHLESVIRELHQRSERVQVLETELGGVKKEMETKMTIISGLTRERSSLKQSSPVDISMFSSMRDQILKHEEQLQTMHSSAIARESELNNEIDTLRTALAKGGIEAPQGEQATLSTERNLEESELSAKVTQLQEELRMWENKHKNALESMQASEGRLKRTIADLETTLTEAQDMHNAKTAELDSQGNSIAAAAAAFDLERQKHAQHAEYLTKEVNDAKALAQSYATHITDLEATRASYEEAFEKSEAFKAETQQHLDAHRKQIVLLQNQLEEHQTAVEFHKHGLKSLHDSHSAELDQVRAEAQQQSWSDAEARITELSAQHKQEMDDLESKSQELERQLGEHKIALNDYKQQVEEKAVLVTRLEQEKQAHSRSASNASGELTQAQSRLRSLEEEQTAAKEALEKARNQLAELDQTKANLNSELDQIREKEQRASRLVEELQGELANSFELNQAATGRLSLMQNSKEQELAEARAATVKAQDEITALKSRLEQVEGQRGSVISGTNETGERSNSLTSTTRKSSSVSTLPSPPPVIPLPPIPTGSPTPNSQKEFMDKRAEEQENRIRTIEKHLFAEKQLTNTLEEALVDLETQGKKTKAEVETWKRKAWDYEDELTALRKERNANRSSLQAVEEERNARREAEAARAHLEERMAQLNKKKKKSTLNCF